MDGRKHAPYHDTADFRQAYKMVQPLKVLISSTVNSQRSFCIANIVWRQYPSKSSHWFSMVTSRTWYGHAFHIIDPLGEESSTGSSVDGPPSQNVVERYFGTNRGRWQSWHISTFKWQVIAHYYILHKLNEQDIVTTCIIMMYFHTSNGKSSFPVYVTQAEWTTYNHDVHYHDIFLHFKWQVIAPSVCYTSWMNNI